jgi:hypothetical protein
MNKLAADLQGIHVLIGDISFQPQQPICDKEEEDSTDKQWP